MHRPPFGLRLSLALAVVLTAKSPHFCGAADPVSTDLVSAKNTVLAKELRALNMVPRGAAVVTSSGRLADMGITKIIHAAPAAMSPPASDESYQPSLRSIENSIRNAVLLAEFHRLPGLAIPVVGGGVFFDDLHCSRRQLVDSVVVGAAGSAKVDIAFIASNDADFSFLTRSVAHCCLPATRFRVLKGDITDYGLHKSPAIVNAANMEVQFGAGLSGVIGRATAAQDAINSEAQPRIAVVRF